ncbi:ARPP-1 family domain-containing protein [Haliangium sp.]|uniref:ARPP-1 family domain-containing protein n=1 Tax=Haliangium sp. TaxID=2663208 RepID=UPI003D142BFA
MKLSIEEILADRHVGRMQSVGPMQVIPILGEDDDGFAPPDLDAGTTGYGRVEVRNRHDRGTIVPPGSAWIVDRRVQDHAIGAGALVPAKAARTLDRAMCIQQSQPGLIEVERHPLQILPARLRATALALRDQDEYNRLWSHISAFKAAHGLTGSMGNLVDFLRAFARELDQFVAEFELVPQQVGALILVGGRLVGIELAPSAAYWEAVWVPLVRVCYGTVALEVGRRTAAPPPTRSALQVLHGSVEGIAEAVAAADRADEQVVRDVVTSVAGTKVRALPGKADTLGDAKLRTVESKHLIGQVVVRTGGRVPYASLLARAA